MFTYSYIYKATNLVTGKSYIGQSVRPVERIKRHIACYESTYLTRAINLYGRENFEWEIIHSFVPLNEIDLLEETEIKQSNSLSPNGYNITPGGSKPPSHLGKKMTSEQKAKISQSNKGKRRTPEQKAKISASVAGIRLGYKHPDSVKFKIGQTVRRTKALRKKNDR